ncbi:hypothetical protein J6590_012872 [Homalodisca vitripennis]|nr:hypothetical protein J6590_012872 [Homalodisca vitripennis]
MHCAQNDAICSEIVVDCCCLCLLKMFTTLERPADCEIWSVIQFLTARNVSAVDIRQISEVYGPNAMSDSKVRKWIQPDVSSNVIKPELAFDERQRNEDVSVSKNSEPDTNTQGDTRMNRMGSRQPQSGEPRNDFAQTHRSGRSNQRRRFDDNNGPHQPVGRGRGARHGQENYTDKNSNYHGKHSNDRGNYSSNLSKNQNQQNNRNNQYSTQGGTNSHKEVGPRESNDTRDGRGSPLDTNLPKDNKESLPRDSSGNRGKFTYLTIDLYCTYNIAHSDKESVPMGQNGVKDGHGCPLDTSLLKDMASLRRDSSGKRVKFN